MNHFKLKWNFKFKQKWDVISKEIAKSFLEFDTDDGRSSKLCQKEDDDDYYGKLEFEYKENGKYRENGTFFWR